MEGVLREDITRCLPAKRNPRAVWKGVAWADRGGDQ